MKTTNRVEYFFRRGGVPGTIGLIASLLAVFVLSWLMSGKIADPLQFYSNWSQPWGLVTYMWASMGNGQELFWFLIELYWLWWVGSAAEAQLGTGKFVGFFIVSGVVAALFIWAGLSMVHPGLYVAIMGGPGLAIAALTVAWGARNPHQNILLFGIIPIPGWILAWLTVALTLFGYGSMYRAPLIGGFAVLHLGLAYLFATNRIPGLLYSREQAPRRSQLKATEARDRSYYDDVKKREQERAERERLRKLFEDSMKDDQG